MNIASCQLPIAGDDCQALSECARPRAQERPIWQNESNIQNPADRQPFCARGRAHSKTRRAFTLIEMLVVIAIIGILAALIVGGLSRSGGLKVRSRVKTELAGLEAAIGSYYKKHGFYPPGNENRLNGNVINTGTNQLFYELTSTDYGLGEGWTSG